MVARITFESVHAGQQLPRLDVPITASLIVAGAIATSDFSLVHHDKAHAQANQIVDKAKTDALLEAARVKASAQADIDGMVGKAREALRGQVAALAVQGASKIVQREIDPAAHKALLDQLVTEI